MAVSCELLVIRLPPADPVSTAGGSAMPNEATACALMTHVTIMTASETTIITVPSMISAPWNIELRRNMAKIASRHAACEQARSMLAQLHHRVLGAGN